LMKWWSVVRFMKAETDFPRIFPARIRRYGRISGDAPCVVLTID
jgi:hypothetical protein